MSDSQDLQPATWARAMASDDEFRNEQEKLGRVWTMLGYLEDLPNVNDWFRTTLGGRSVFIQRFKDGVRGFENMCMHRFHPIRNEDRGNGPVLCAYHHWSYDQEGRATGIPKCREMYGVPPGELHVRLRPLQVEICGGLIFGRFGDGISLRDWLGKGFDILAGLTANRPSSGKTELICKAHWKLAFNISAEDYHIAAVHPSTFGQSGIHPNDRVKYYRFGAHSAFFLHGEERDLEEFSADAGTGRHVHLRPYRVFQFFPGVITPILSVASLFGDSYWYLIIMNLVPEARDRTRIKMHFFPLPFERPATPLRQALRRVTGWFLQFGIHHQARKIVREDNLACERMQLIAHQISGNPLLATQEMRVGWIEEEYARIMGYPYSGNPDK